MFQASKYFYNYSKKKANDYYRQLCSETYGMIYIEEATVKLYGSSIDWPCTLVPGFDCEAIIQPESLVGSDICRVYFLLLSFTCPFYQQQQKLLNVFEEQKLMSQRELNSIEHKLFKLSTYTQAVEQCNFVSSLNEFINNMNIHFHFDKYVTPSYICAYIIII